MRFKGTFRKGLKEGKGILEDIDGIRYEGNFSGDKKNGEFIEKDKNGLLLRKVVYHNGIAVGTWKRPPLAPRGRERIRLSNRKNVK